jgi:hypothetical protein
LSVWTERDLVVLRALIRSENEYVRTGYLTIGHGRGAEELGASLDDADIHDSLLTLQEAGYADFDVAYESGPGAHFTHLSITGAGLQVIGEWPLFDAATSPEAIALLLERLAPEAPTDEETTNMGRAATYVRSLAPGVFRGFVTGAISAIMRSRLGLP